MAIEVWARDRLDEGLDSGVLVFVDERGDDEFAQILLVCGEDLNAGQLVSPERPPDPERTEPPMPESPPPGIPILPPRTRTRKRRRFLIGLSELDSGVHAFDSRRLVDRALNAIERDEDPVSLNPANREEWGYIDTLPAAGEARELSSAW